MSKRLIIEHVEPAAMSALMQLEAYLSTVSVPKKNIFLMEVRASQINGCSYCINMHTKNALHLGETQERIDLISNWKQTTAFSPEEKLLFAITEEITLISEHGLSDELYNDAESHFGKKLTAQIIMIVIIINAWNRLAVSLKTGKV
ncbi:carboxymuconolactone decarboxylase family protein [Parapedobacter tibetensis]|uniref:carboxymuconolactone decarboxylase family protein n=1 Tax=Parapedobacter tibetensis TaxID=2972951 RepID=UPI00214D9ECE|nr:carboxymuconolactone decarboxylase family protein [Parapedobacter tibetensis]